MSQESPISIGRLILIPGLITLGVTILRLVGELLQWSKIWFNPQAGGGFAPIGIVWLPIIFGVYFALKLTGAGAGPTSLSRTFAFWGLGLLLLVAGGYLAFSAFQSNSLVKGLAALALMAGAVVVQFWGWSSLTKVLVAYGYAARIPVVIIMFFAIRGNWGTHYDGPPPNFPEMSFLPKFFLIGFLPQMITWIAFTVIVGSIFGTVATAIVHRGKAVAQVTP